MSLPSLRLTASLAALGAATVVLSAPATPAKADEGMWTFDNFPIATVNEKYGTNLDQAWLDRVRNAAVRLQGCSASLVSGEGLILTNHHCVVSCVQDLSDAQNDYVKNGWMPATREEEKKCPGQTAEILTDITDVTDRVTAAGAGLEGAAFVRARAAEIDKIQKEVCGDDQKLTCQVISLYRGGQYKLYKFRKYEDVRLVFAPEFQAAFFGGDPDNFNFPRYALDAAFLRAYEDGKPVSTPNHLTWNPNAPKEGDVTFVAGNPGSTSRLLTMAQLEVLRDQQLPITLIQTSELRGRLLEYATTSEEAKRVSVDPIFGLENSFKVYYGQQGALTDPAFMATKRREEQELRQRVAADPALAQRIGDPWADLERASTAQRDLYLPYRQLESAAGQRSSLYSYAKAIVRAAKERAKPAAERRAGYSEADIAALGRRLAQDAPISDDIEKIQMSFWLSKTREYLTVDMGKESPEGLSARLVAGTTLADPAVRRTLWTGGLAAIQASTDPMIQYALAIDADARAVRAEWEEKVQAPTDRASEQLAAARFAAYGDAVYPDATGTLRLTYGKVEGSDVPGQRFAAFTTFAGLWDRATGAEPFAVAPKLLAAKDRIDPNAVMDMAVSTDTIGGSSGSPAINARGEIIGANFDSTVLTQRNAYGYDRAVNRSVIVTTQAVTVALRDVYGLDHLVQELGVSPDRER